MPTAVAPPAPDTREAWLGRAAAALTELVIPSEYEVPPLRLSVGFGRGKGGIVGQCWSTSCADDDVNQIFLSPVRGEEETVDVLATLLHEIIHSLDNCQSGHKGAFALVARAVGFQTPLTSSANRSEELEKLLTEIVELPGVGLFPHAKLDVGGGLGGEKTQSTRMIKIVCPDDGYIARTSRKWLDDLGAPTCPCGQQMEEA